MIDLAAPSSGREQAEPPASPQVGAGTAKGTTREVTVAISSTDTSCEALFSWEASCTWTDGGSVGRLSVHINLNGCDQTFGWWSWTVRIRPLEQNYCVGLRGIYLLAMETSGKV